MEKLNDAAIAPGSTSAQSQLAHLNALILILGEMEGDKENTSSSSPPPIDQDTKSLLLAGDEEAFLRVKERVDGVMEAYRRDKHLKNRNSDIGVKESRSSHLLTLKALNSQRSVTYDTPQK